MTKEASEAPVVKKLPANAWDKERHKRGSRILLRRSLGRGNGYALQYSFLENSMDRGAQWAIAHGIAKRVGQYWATEHEHLDTKKHKAKDSKELSGSFVCEWFIATKWV